MKRILHQRLIMAFIALLLSSSLFGQEPAYISFKHYPNGDGLIFSGRLYYQANVNGGPEFRVWVQGFKIDGLVVNGRNYYNGLQLPSGKVKGSIVLSGNIAYNTYDIIKYQNANITIELSEGTTMANSLQDNGSAYFSEAITDANFPNKTEDLQLIKRNKTDTEWKEDWKKYAYISSINVDKYYDLNVGGKDLYQVLKEQCLSAGNTQNSNQHKQENLDKQIVEDRLKELELEERARQNQSTSNFSTYKTNANYSYTSDVIRSGEAKIAAYEAAERQVKSIANDYYKRVQERSRLEKIEMEEEERRQEDEEAKRIAINRQKNKIKERLYNTHREFYKPLDDFYNAYDCPANYDKSSSDKIFSDAKSNGIEVLYVIMIFYEKHVLDFKDYANLNLEELIDYEKDTYAPPSVDVYYSNELRIKLTDNYNEEWYRMEDYLDKAFPEMKGLPSKAFFSFRSGEALNEVNDLFVRNSYLGNIRMHPITGDMIPYAKEYKEYMEKKILEEERQNKLLAEKTEQERLERKEEEERLLELRYQQEIQDNDAYKDLNVLLSNKDSLGIKSFIQKYPNSKYNKEAELYLNLSRIEEVIIVKESSETNLKFLSPEDFAKYRKNLWSLNYVNIQNVDDVSSNEILNLIKSLTEQPSISTLRMKIGYHTPINQEIIDAIFKLNELKILWFEVSTNDSNLFSDINFDGITNFDSLKHFRLRYYHYSNSTIYAPKNLIYKLNQMNNLKVLDLSSLKMNNEKLDFGNLKDMEELIIHNCANFEISQNLNQLKKFKYLWVTGCVMIGLPEFKKLMRELKKKDVHIVYSE